MAEPPQALASEGELELRSSRFPMVSEMTLARYMKVRLIRLELEGLAAQIAAGRRPRWRPQGSLEAG